MVSLLLRGGAIRLLLVAVVVAVLPLLPPVGVAHAESHGLATSIRHGNDKDLMLHVLSEVASGA